MDYKLKALEDLVAQFSRLPGIGRKSASRIVFYLLKTDESFSKILADRIESLRKSIRFCSICGSYTESDPCPICMSETRDKNLLCVVEQPQDVMTIESGREFTGLYHVLGGLIAPLDGYGPEKLRLDSLEHRVRNGKFKEIIIATNPTVEGDTTALYIKNMLDDTGLEITRLATGIPVGGDLEYADRLTLLRSFRGRIKL